MKGLSPTFLSRWPVQSTKGREAPTLDQCELSPGSHHSDPGQREGGRSHLHWGVKAMVYLCSTLASLWGCGYFQLVLALVHTAEYIPSFHSCTCQNRSLWYVSCYYGNFIVTGVHIVSLNEDTYVLYWWLWYSSFWPPFWAQTGEERPPDSNQWRGKNQSELIQNQVVEINCMNCTKIAIKKKHGYFMNMWW